MKYFSEVLNRLYDTQDSLEADEKAYYTKVEEERIKKEKAIAEKKAKHEYMLAAKQAYETALSEYKKARDEYYGIPLGINIIEKKENEKDTEAKKQVDSNDTLHNLIQLFSSIFED